MTLLDRYIAKQYLMNIVALFVILFCFIMTIDISVNLDRFIELADNFSHQQGGSGSLIRKAAITVFLILDLWWPRLIELTNYMLGLVMVGAMGFTFTQMVRHRELVAVLAGGISLHRVARPIMLVAVGLTLLQALSQEFVVPNLSDRLTRDHGEAGRRKLDADIVPLVADNQGRLWYAKSFDADVGSLHDVYIWQRDEQGLATIRIRAEEARWTTGVWVLYGVQAWVAGTNQQLADPPTRIKTEMDPTALKMKRFAGYQQNLSWRQISQMLENEDVGQSMLRDGLERVRFGRVSSMLTNLLSLMISLPFYLTRVPKNMMIQSLKGAPVAIVALLGAALGVAAVIPGLPAAIAVFIPVMVLTPVAIASLTAMET